MGGIILGGAKKGTMQSLMMMNIFFSSNLSAHYLNLLSRGIFMFAGHTRFELLVFLDELNNSTTDMYQLQRTLK